MSEKEEENELQPIADLKTPVSESTDAKVIATTPDTPPESNDDVSNTPPQSSDIVSNAPTQLNDNVPDPSSQSQDDVPDISKSDDITSNTTSQSNDAVPTESANEEMESENLKSEIGSTTVDESSHLETSETPKPEEPKVDSPKLTEDFTNPEVEPEKLTENSENPENDSTKPIDELTKPEDGSISPKEIPADIPVTDDKSNSTVQVSSEESTTKETPVNTDQSPEPAKEKEPEEKAIVPEEKDEPKLDDSGEVADELKKMIKELQEPANVQSGETVKPQAGKETTENLISVLEDGVDAQKEKKPPPTEAEKPSSTTSKPKKYLYKLKSKTGKVLHYTSTIPITLKRPVIHLTKMEEYKDKNPVQKVIDLDKDDVDSDNSTKENNVKENEAPNDNVMPVVRKKGRPPLSSRPPVITLDGNSSDNTDSKDKNSPAFSMQTRKRQLKFLPDGRLITPQKRIRSDDKKTDTSSSDSEIDIISSDGEQTDSSLRKIKKLESAKKFKPEVKPNSTGEKRKYKKIFDFESYYREKTGIAPPPSILRTQQMERKILTTPIKKLIDFPKQPITPVNSAASKKQSSVDPAQLLSSLIGVPINQSQLNIVKFKPKIIHERANNIVTSTPKKVTFEDEKKKFTPTNQSELLKSTPFKIVSKPTYQKILPKPSTDRVTVMPSRVYQPVAADNRYSNTGSLSALSPFTHEPLNVTLSKFESFSDSKVVKTREGPRKFLKRKHDDANDSPRTIYDVMYDIFDKMPSWNLHVIPDTNGFCIAQVSRGRMGIPTLKKSIEFNSEFVAKVYVHQLHCKRYDGTYDTESKIIKLIREIDALAA